LRFVSTSDIARYGVPTRLVDQLPPYAPTITYIRAYRPVGKFAQTPLGVICHGSRSGQPYTRAVEYRGTCNWAANPTNPYAWNHTIGDDTACQHLTASEHGLNAGTLASTLWLAVEFAQAGRTTPISDAQVNTFCWLFENKYRVRWPDLPAIFIPHGSTPQGRADGKDDCFPPNSPAWADLERRIFARLKLLGVRV
jgi:hypothetical protein